VTPTGDIEHLHNQLVAAIYGNVTREMPDHGVASWVSANDKPTTGAGNKPVSGDAAEQRLKTEVMQLPSRDRRRLKDLSQNEVCLLLKLVVLRLRNDLRKVRSPGCFCKYIR
jgi:transcriptional coactivator HFI1/ADA1